MSPEADPGETIEGLSRDYANSLREYIGEGGERWLNDGHLLGRRAMRMGLGILDVVELHASAVGSLDPGRGFGFLSEVLGPYEMTHRGFEESNARLQKANVALREQIDAYDVQHRIALLLQEAILEQPPEVPGLQIGICYASSTEEALVGGDFYDVFTLSDRRAYCVIGDVSGKGIEAGGLAAMAKNSIRVCAVMDPRPHAMLSCVNKSLDRFTPDEVFVTAFVALVEADARRITYCSAGHPAPIVITAQGRARRLDTAKATGPVLGACVDGRYKSGVCSLGAGDTLVLFTDGAVEARRDGVLLGDDGFRDLLRVEEAVDPSRLLAVALEDLRDYSRGQLRDDIAMLAVRFSAA